MGNKWIIDVIADLKAFAEENDLPQLADQLDRTAVVAAAEIVAIPKDMPVISGAEHRVVGFVS